MEIKKTNLLISVLACLCATSAVLVWLALSPQVHNKKTSQDIAADDIDDSGILESAIDQKPGDLRRKLSKARSVELGSEQSSGHQSSRTFHFRVRVVDSTGSPVKGARVNSAGKSGFPNRNNLEIRWPNKERRNHKELSRARFSFSSITDLNGFAFAETGVAVDKPTVFSGNALEGTITAEKGSLYGELYLGGVPRETETIVLHTRKPFEIISIQDNHPIEGVPISLSYDILDSSGNSVGHRKRELLGNTNKRGSLVIYLFEDRMREILRVGRKIESLALEASILGADVSEKISYANLAEGGSATLEVPPLTNLRVVLQDEYGLPYKGECMVAVLDSDPTKMLETLDGSDFAERALSGKFSGDIIWLRFANGESQILRKHIVSKKPWYVFGVAGRLSSKAHLALPSESKDGSELIARVKMPALTTIRMEILGRNGIPLRNKPMSLVLRTKEHRLRVSVQSDDHGFITLASGEILLGEILTHLDIDGEGEIGGLGARIHMSTVLVQMNHLTEVRLEEIPLLLKVNLAGGDSSALFSSEVGESQNGPWRAHKERVIYNYPLVEFRSWAKPAQFIKVQVQHPKLSIGGNDVFPVGAEYVVLSLKESRGLNLVIEANAVRDLFIQLEDDGGNRYASKRKVLSEDKAIYKCRALTAGTYKIIGRYLACPAERDLGGIEVEVDSSEELNPVESSLDVRFESGESVIQANLETDFSKTRVYLKCRSHEGNMRRVRVMGEKIVFGHWGSAFSDGVMIRIGSSSNGEVFALDLVYEGVELNASCMLK